MEARDAQREHERAERDRLRATVDARINEWTRGGERRHNLRALLGSLHHVLWNGAAWRPPGMQALIEPRRVKIAYHRAILVTHPDKCAARSDLSVEQCMVAEEVFTVLQKAYDAFERAELST